MKKILKYSTIIGAAAMLAGSAIADTGGYVRVKGFESHFHSFGFNQIGCNKSGGESQNCLLASEESDKDAGNAGRLKNNELTWAEDDGNGIVVGADYGFFRLEVEGTYQDGGAKSWRGHTATGGNVYQARIFANVVAEPFDLIELLGEFGGIEPLVKYNPAHYGISPYAMYGYGVMGGLLTNLSYTRTSSASDGRMKASTPKVSGAYAGGATAAINAGAGVNIGLDQMARGFQELTGASTPEWFKLPIEFSIGYHFQADVGDLLFESINEDLGIDDSGMTYSVGLKW